MAQVCTTDGRSLSECVGVHQEPGMGGGVGSFSSGNSRWKGMAMLNSTASSSRHNSVDGSGMQKLCRWVEETEREEKVEASSREAL